jgi:serine/threonine-protein kinase RsbT
MPVLRNDLVPIKSPGDIVTIRQLARTRAVEVGFGLVDQTKIVTAASELARNTLDYGLGGTVLLELLAEGNRKGLRLTFEDHGPGIPDIEQALKDGFTSGGGLGLGLGGARRLMNDFSLESEPGKGTRVRVTRWR